MAVVTVSRQYASGGSTVAEMVAEQLGWQLVDNEFIDRVAERAQLPREAIEQREERVLSLFDRIANALAFSSGDLYTTGARPVTPMPELTDLAQITTLVIEEAFKGGEVVLVGRGAQACLAACEDCTHVFVTCSKETRIERIMELDRLDRDAAAARIEEVDGHRRRYVKRHYGRDWEDPDNYDLCINTARVGYREAAEMVRRLVAGKRVG